MNDKFFELPKEKQDNMLNAAMAVFAKSEYKKASTDEIVKRAGISKGLLFYYFGNKKELYLYLYKHAEQVLIKEMTENYDYEETDFFRMLEKAQMCKLSILKRFPDLFNFLTRSYIETNDAVEEKISDNFKKIMASSARIFLERADAKKFKDGISLPQVLNIVIWMADGFIRSKGQAVLDNLEKYNEEYLEYVELLRRQFYKEEYV